MNINLKSERIWLLLSIVVIIGLALFTRFYKLTQLPVGLHIDEAGMAFDAYSLAYWRVERHMIHLPIYLPNYGGGQSAFYAYICAVFIRIFGLSTFIIRLPAALFSLAIILFGSLITYHTYGKKSALITAFLLTIMPYFIMQGRFGYDCNLFLGTSVISMYLTLLAIKKDRVKYYLFSGIAWGVTLYTYALSWIVIPLFLILTVVYLIYLKKISFKQLLAFSTPIVLLAIPLIVLVIINTYKLSPVFSRFFYIPILGAYRLNEVSTLASFDKIIHELPGMLFIADDEGLLRYPAFYYVSIPFILVGMILSIVKVYKAIRTRSYRADSLILFYVISNVLLFIIKNGAGNHMVNSIYFPLAYIGIYAIVTLGNLIRKPLFKKSYYFILIAIYVASFANFTKQYFYVYPTAGYQESFSETFTTTLDGLYEYAAKHNFSDEIEKRQIWLNGTYIYYYLGAKTPPSEMNLTADILNEVRFKNLHFEFLPETSGGLFSFIPSQIEDRDIYIIEQVNSSYIDKLKSNGLIEIFRDGQYSVYLKPDTFQK